MRLETGTIFHGYQILQFLGAGGAGSVYRALQTGLEREVALKVVNVGGQPGSELRKRFLREARALARLAHPHIVRIYEFGEDGPSLYYSMEFVAGLSLDHHLSSQGHLEPQRSIELLSQVLDAVQTVHELGVLHRDIKPANVLLGPDGDAVLSDFGLARERDATRLTRDGVMLGTLPYLPPELCHEAEPDARGDLYQAAVMFYELLAGVPPYRSDQILSMLRGEPPDPAAAVERLARSCPPGLLSFLVKALQPEPAARFQTAAEMRAALLSLEGLSARSEASSRTSELASSSAVRDSAVGMPPAGDRAPTRSGRDASGRHPARTARRTPVPVGAVSGPHRPSPVEDQPTLTAPIRMPGRHPARPWLLAIAAVCWLLLMFAGWRIWSPNSKPARLPRATTASDAARPRSPASRRAQAAEVFHRHLLAETDLPLAVTPPVRPESFTLEVGLVLVDELEEALLRLDGAAAGHGLLELNGRPVSTAGERLPVGRLVNGNNRMVFQGSLPRGTKTAGHLVIRRRQGASLRVPAATAPAQPETAAGREGAKLIARARACFQDGRFGDAAQIYSEASRIDPESWQSSWYKGIALHNTAYVARGLQAAGPGLELLTPVREGDPEEMRREEFECFGKALRRRPQEADLWFDFGWAYRDYLRQADAERMMGFACTVDNTSMRLWWELARTLAQRLSSAGEGRAALESLIVEAAQAAFHEEPKLKVPWLAERGALYKRLGRLDDARRDFEQVLRHDPTNRIARTGLESLTRR